MNANLNVASSKMSAMLCCSGEKDSAARDLKSAQNTPSRQPMQPPYTMGTGQFMGPNQQPPPPNAAGGGYNMVGGGPPFRQPGPMYGPPGQMNQQQAGTRVMGPNNFMGNSGGPPGGGPLGPKDDYRKGTGISEEVFRQIETVQNRYDSSTAAAFRAVQKSGEMVVRTLDPRQFIRLASETAPKINIDTNDPDAMTSFVEIVKRPGQTLGLYIREGNGIDRSDGVFISRIAPESSIFNSGCLQIGDEILAVNLVDVTRMSLDDVVIIMSIPRRLVLTTRRGAAARFGPGVAGGPPAAINSNTNMHMPGQPPGPGGPGTGRLNGEGNKPGVVVYKGQNSYSSYGGDSMDSPGRRGPDYMAGYPPPRDARTLTWDRNPKPDRNDPKYFPVNSLPRHPGNGMRPPGPGGPVANNNSINSPGMAIEEGMPPPMRELNTTSTSAWGNEYPVPVSSGAGNGPGPPGGDYYNPNTSIESEPGPGRGQRLLHRMAQDGYGGGRHMAHGTNGDLGGPPPQQQQRGYSTLQYQRQYPRGGSAPNGGMVSSGGRSRHYSGMDYASDTEALQSPVLSVRGMRSMAHGGRSHGSRTNSLPRTFQREALLRHPELSMEMDRLASPSSGLPFSHDDPMSDSGIISAPENNMHSAMRGKRGYRSPSSMSAMGGGGDPRASFGNGYKDLRRTPSTSAIYETLRRSKELRESLSSRPSSRLSLRGDSTDAQYFSDSEHQMVSGSWSQYRGSLGGGGAHGDMHRRLRNRTLTGLETMRLPGGMDHLRPGSAQGRPITPSFSNDKDPGQTFIDFNPADFIKYKSECDPEASAIRLSGILSLHLLSGRGLRTGGRSRRIRDLYCVVEVDHIHKARTVVRSGGVNFDWDEKFELDLANNLEVEFLVYSWDPQLRHRLCYRSSLRLAALFGKGQTFQQVALRMHPAGTLYLTLRFTDLREAYDRSRTPALHPPTALPGISPVVVSSALVTGRPGPVVGPGVKSLFGNSLEVVLERESSGFAVPLIVKRCTDEVEKRGLDIIGIYRLCGSETKKQMLREAFEESPELVDLSSENVPDINVITGLLKEYLRELPEPVFSNCLYQMLVDAMGVFLPDDPDGNAKLVFSILDCLPKANRNCLVHIMDHLSKVTAQSSRNKMNPQNLAICFAPVLMMDFSQSQPSATNISEPIQILKYLIEIWPKNADNVL